MSRSQKLLALGAGLALAAVFALVALRPAPVEAKSDLPPGAVYYTGPMKQKGKDVYATESGKVVSPEEADRASAEFQKATVPTSPDAGKTTP